MRPRCAAFQRSGFAMNDHDLALNASGIAAFAALVFTIAAYLV